jgi:predicted MFS family arabinose efflux permease
VAGPAIGALAALGGPKVPFLVAAAIAAANAVAAVRRLPETHRPGAADDGAVRPTDAPADASRRRIADLVLLGFVSLCAFSAFEATFALFGERRLDLHLASTGAVFACIGLVLAFVQVGLVHPVVGRLGDARTLGVGLALNALGLLLLAATHSWLLLVPSLLALTIGQGLAMPALTASVAGRADPARRGRALGFNQSAGGLARVVGPAAGGFAFQHIGVPAPYLGGAVLLAACASAAAIASSGVRR